MRLTAKNAWLLTIITLMMVCGLSAPNFAGPDKTTGPMDCVSTGSGCSDCVSTAGHLSPFYCDIGSPPYPFIQGTCLERPGTCGDWSSYNCGRARRCSNFAYIGQLECGTLEFCIPAQ